MNTDANGLNLEMDNQISSSASQETSETACEINSTIRARGLQTDLFGELVCEDDFLHNLASGDEAPPLESADLIERAELSESADLIERAELEKIPEAPMPEIKAAPAKSSPKSFKAVELSLGDTKVRVRTDATPSMLKQIRDLTDSRYHDFKNKYEAAAAKQSGLVNESQSVKGISAHQLTVLLAFSLAEELLKEKEKVRQMKRKVAECAERLMDRVESQLRRDQGA